MRQGMRTVVGRFSVALRLWTPRQQRETWQENFGFAYSSSLSPQQVIRVKRVITRLFAQVRTADHDLLEKAYRVKWANSDGYTVNPYYGEYLWVYGTQAVVARERLVRAWRLARIAGITGISIPVPPIPHEWGGTVKFKSWRVGNN